VPLGQGRTLLGVCFLCLLFRGVGFEGWWCLVLLGSPNEKCGTRFDEAIAQISLYESEKGGHGRVHGKAQGCVGFWEGSILRSGNETGPRRAEALLKKIP